MIYNICRQVSYLTDKIKTILNKNNIENFGVCGFADFKDSLINCAAKKRLPENAKSVIVCIFPYRVKKQKPQNICRYCSIEDYHIICGEILSSAATQLTKEFEGFTFVHFADNSPVPEVKAAALSGLGVVGKNHLLINEKYGSFVFIGEIVTDLEIKFKKKKIKNCIGCDQCIKSCPTGHLSKEKNICLSSLTQKKGNLTPAEEKIIKNNNTVWGCDICQDVCPMNSNKELTNIKEFVSSYRDKYEIYEDSYHRPYLWRGTEVIERNYKIINEN